MELYANLSRKGETIYSKFGWFACGLFLAYVGGVLVVVLFSLPDLFLSAAFDKFFKDVFGCFLYSFLCTLELPLSLLYP